MTCVDCLRPLAWMYGSNVVGIFGRCPASSSATVMVWMALAFVVRRAVTLIR